MSRERKEPEVTNNEVPAWIISFSDMITLLLAFFVLLQAFAHEKSPELFHVGQGSFRQAISGLGLPQFLYGKPNPIRRQWLVKRYPVEPDPKEAEVTPVIDAQEDEVQRLFQNLKENMESQSENMDSKQIRVEALPIHFMEGSARLDTATRGYLDRLAVDLRQNLTGKTVRVYIVALAPDERTSEKQWVLSGQRAREIQAYLAKRLTGTDRTWTLNAWGGGRQFGRFPVGTFAGMVISGAD